MMEVYGGENSLRVTVHILKKLGQLADTLQKGMLGVCGDPVDGETERVAVARDLARCEVCQQLPNDPVPIACGHQFCARCRPGLSDDRPCPACGKKSRLSVLPVLEPLPSSPPGGRAAQGTSGVRAPVIHSAISAQTGATINVPTITGCQIGGSVIIHAESNPKESEHLTMEKVLLEHKSLMKKRFECIFEGVEKKNNKTLLNKVYTDLYITEGESEEVNGEHEVWQLEAASRKPTARDGTAINCNDIFKPLPGQEEHIRVVLTKGIAGIGKTVSVQKFILDWADGSANQDVDFIFALPFRELNLVKSRRYSLLGLLLEFHPELRGLGDSRMWNGRKTVFLFDGLDESRLKMDFGKTRLADAGEVSSVDALVANLIEGKLLPSAFIWVTSRPAAASQIPSRYVDQLTEVRGFSVPQREEYFRKKVRDGAQAGRIISHIKVSRSLHIMCHIPVFCWISATVLQKMLAEEDDREIPKTLTEMYAHFLVIQTNIRSQKYHGESEADREKLLCSHRDVLLKLAELAFLHLENGNLMFYEEDLRECGIDVDEASVYSGMCTEIFREELVFFQRKVYCFVHLSIQEFLAAVYVFHCYVSRSMAALRSFLKGKSRASPGNIPLDVLLSSAVNKASESSNGHLDLFLRFLHGISLEANQRLLLGLLKQTKNDPSSVKKTIQNLKEMQRKNISPERCINLFHCLIEMNDSSVHDEIQAFLKSERGSVKLLSPAHCSALAYMLLMSEEPLEELDLRRYKTSDEGRRRLLPAVRYCRTARIGGCRLTEKMCETVAWALRAASSHLRELDLSDSVLLDSGVRMLTSSLMSPSCKLETLRFTKCKLTRKSWENLTSTLLAGSSQVRELDLLDNELQDAAVELLSDGIPRCGLRTLRLSHCRLTEKGCAALTPALCSAGSPVRTLDLSGNDLQDPGVEALSGGLKSPECKLEALSLSFCGITGQGCASLASALTSNPSHLRELDLSYNHLGDQGVGLLSGCGLRALRVDHGGVYCLTRDLKKYACRLALDPDTAYGELSLCREKRKATFASVPDWSPDRPERFLLCPQVLCGDGLTGRAYWEVEWTGTRVIIGGAYKGLSRKGAADVAGLGATENSWDLECSARSGYVAWHHEKRTEVPARGGLSGRVGVFLDWSAGTLSFYTVSLETVTHLHTFRATFAEPVYPGFWVSPESSVSLQHLT
ncbi:NLR family CARD domain-containing protein 3-like [Denticeps clupeoides]|uniref:NLR family CARD domain-containing protein 3-like n=1 Tax=Denticeps clupeoides TaxID=299321 RepID=UPI0010A400B8|nr:NLR family CARD domain-containing protein 3-like [Denticeps clupeoides]